MVIYVLIYANKQKKNVELLVLLSLVSLIASKKSPPEYSSISGSTAKALWTSDLIQDQIVISNPPCQDTSDWLMTRVSTDGTWNSPPLCTEISNKSPDTTEYDNIFNNCLLFKSVERCANLSTNLCPQNCVLSNSHSKCYCKRQNCQTVATIRNLDDKKTIQELAANEMCRINESKFLKSLHPYINATHWIYGNFYTNCTICESPTRSASSKLVLSFEEKKNSLYLLVYSPENILRKKKELQIFCFTNAPKTVLKKKTRTSLVFNHSDSDPDFPYNLLVYKVETEKYMGEYWCEAFTQNFSLVKSERVIAYEKKKGNEYALRLFVTGGCKFSHCELNELFKYLTKNKLKELFKKFDAEVRVMEVLKLDLYNDEADILFHLSTGGNCDVETEYYKLLKTMKILRYYGMTVVDFRSSEFCLPERTRLGHFVLEWPLTKLNNVVVPRQFCLESDGIPVIRQCQGSFVHGAFWSNVTGNCIDNPAVSSVTIKLRDVATSSQTSVETVWNIVSSADLTVLDIYYLDLILEKIPDNNYALDFVNKLMITDDDTLRKSQNVLNLADTTLDIIESIVANLTSYANSVYLVRKDNLIVHITNPFQSNISGLLVYDHGVKDFQRGNSFDDVDKNNLQLGVYVPEMILEQIMNETNSSVSDVIITTVVFYNDHFFIDNNYHSGSFVVSVSIPGYGTYLQSPIPILFKSKNHTNSNMCGFWDNGKRIHRKKGTWSVLGSNYVQNHTDDLHECSFIHLTHFALLVMSDKKVIPDGDEVETESLEDLNEYVLEIVTIVGCVVSGISILGIFLTAFFYETWRKRIGTKILLNLSVAIVMEIICMHLSELKTLKKSEGSCKVLGVILHYVVLSKFVWMLIYALLQYYRFVRVIGAVPKKLILKSVILGWGVPLVFVTVVSTISDKSDYVSESYELCYPRGVLLYVTVFFPICLILVANIIIFSLVMYNISHSNNSSSCGKNNLFKLRLCLALLLFSVLGLPWVFGLVAEILPRSIMKVILYNIFCVTAILQGFVLFLFYVVLNRETREFWMRTFTIKK